MKTFYFETFDGDGHQRLGSSNTHIVRCKRLFRRTKTWKTLIANGTSFQVVDKKGNVLDNSQRWDIKVNEVRKRILNEH